MTTFKLNVILGCSVMAMGIAAQPRDVDDRADSPRPSVKPAEALVLDDWSYERVYDGWYADGVVDRAIYGPHGDEIGTVKNLLLNPRGELVALIAEVGGFFEIADTHITIPWREVERRGGRVYSPITAETAENYGMFADEFFAAADVGTFDGVDDVFKTGPYIWKATALLDDYVVLANGAPFGYVTDLVFDDAGKLISVVAVRADGVIGRRGVYALPWDDRGWRPSLDHYTLRATEEAIGRLPTIDYSEFDLTS